MIHPIPCKTAATVTAEVYICRTGRAAIQATTRADGTGRISSDTTLVSTTTINPDQPPAAAPGYPAPPRPRRRLGPLVVPRLVALSPVLGNARQSGHGTARNDPSNRLPGHLRDDLVVGVVVDHREPLALGHRGDQKVGQAH
jgi:hypothetical protein